MTRPGTGRPRPAIADRWMETVGIWDVAGGTRKRAQGRAIDRAFLCTLMLQCNIAAASIVADLGMSRRAS